MTTKKTNSILENGELDWADVENKVQIISRKFSTTIDWKYREDLEQELRLFAWQKSSNYYDMYRHAVDYWRMLTRRVFPEVCVFEFDEFDRMISKIREAVDEYQNSKKEQIDHDNCMKILSLIDDIVKGKESEEVKYTKGKLQVNWVSEKLGIPYNRVQDALWLLQQVTAVLEHLNRIDVPKAYKNLYKPF